MHLHKGNVTHTLQLEYNYNLEEHVAHALDYLPDEKYPDPD